MNWKVRLLAACVAVAPLSAVADGWQSDMMPVDHIFMPTGPARGVAFVLSDAAGWGAREEAIAAKLKADHIGVVGVDMPTYVKAINDQAPVTLKDDPYDPVCSYLVSDVEGLSQQIQRASGSTDYVMPVVAGTGMGGGLALDMTDQTPAVTIGATVVADPASAVPLTNDLCTPAGYVTDSRGEVYALPASQQVDPVSVILSSGVEPDVRTRVEALKAVAKTVTVAENTEPSVALMVRQIEARIDDSRAAMAALPVTILPATPRHDVMAIILSGDGGWRDLDQSVGQIMQADGIPVVGFDSLRYFWSKRTPDEAAKDLATLIKHYHDAWGVNNVILVGYSFGADVLPATFARLPEAARNRVKLISLLGLSTAADWEITVDGWMGSHGSKATPTAPDVAQLPLAKVQCIYGADEDDSGCPAVAALGGEAIKDDGGHHFDGNYAAVEKQIMQAFDDRTQQVAQTDAHPVVAKP
jgi:type IV secretory pathway VirJ component